MSEFLTVLPRPSTMVTQVISGGQCRLDRLPRHAEVSTKYPAIPQQQELRGISREPTR